MAAHLRHQNSLERVIDFAQHDRQDDHTIIAKATDTFHSLVRLPQSNDGPPRGYQRTTLLQSTFDAVQSKSGFLRYLFVFIEKYCFGDANDASLDLSLMLSRYAHLDSCEWAQQHQFERALAAFADHLIDAFFMPMKALGATPILSPATPTIDSHFALAPTEQRDSNLRRRCLHRDGHRCIITQKFDNPTAIERAVQHGGVARDDDGNSLGAETETLQVCHIIPFSLTSHKSKEDRDSDERKIQVATHILDMFDPGVAHLVDGPGIDRAYNAVSLTSTMHGMFGSMRIYFDPTEEQHTYVIRAWVEAVGSLVTPNLPLRRTLRIDPNRTIDPPSPRLLAIHRAVGQILHLSDAGNYIDKILRDLEGTRVILEDGSTAVGNYLNARLGGWAEVTAVG